MGDARRFTEENRNFWRDMEDDAELARLLGKQFRVKAFCEDYRSRLKADGKTYALNNSHTRYFADMLIEQHPELEGTVARRGNGRTQKVA